MTPRLAFLLVATVACASPRAADTARDTSAPLASQSAPRATAASTPTSASESTLVVYKTPTCGCCQKWIDHMREAGFAVEVHNADDLTATKNAAGVPAEMRSCHTAMIGGYAIEGHVPASDVRRLLATRPAVAGIAVPGMPVGSPGMEGMFRERYDVLTFGGKEKPAVFASH